MSAIIKRFRRPKRDKDELARAWKLYGYRCEICSRPGQSVDHVWELCDGGADTVYNMQILCEPCHIRKSQWCAFVRLPKREQERLAELGRAPNRWARNARRGVARGGKRTAAGGT